MIEYPELKKRAITLRKQGLSYGDIKKKIAVSKSTLSIWLKSVKLTKEQRERLYTKQIVILTKGPSSQKERRLKEITEIINNAQKEITSISSESFRAFGLALYWAEGNKKNGLAITNSDPYLILFMVHWFKKVLDVSPQNIKAWLNIHSQHDDLQIKQFWSRLTGIPLENFGKSFIKPANKNYKKNNLYYGTIKIQVQKGTNLRYKIFGLIKRILQDIAPHVEITQQEWKKLTQVTRAINL